MRCVCCPVKLNYIPIMIPLSHAMFPGSFPRQIMLFPGLFSYLISWYNMAKSSLFPSKDIGPILPGNVSRDPGNVLGGQGNVSGCAGSVTRTCRIVWRSRKYVTRYKKRLHSYRKFTQLSISHQKYTRKLGNLPRKRPRK